MGIKTFFVEFRERKALLERISDVDFTAIHEEISSKRHGDTGSWFLQSAGFRKWLEKSSYGILWLNGRVGTGKSVLASVVIEHLIENGLSAKDAVVYAYFKEGSGKLQYKPAQVMASLLKQLCWKLKEIPEAITSLYCARESEARRPTFRDLKDLFYKCSKFFDQIFVVFDGLDTCEGQCRQELLKFVVESENNIHNVKTLIATRRDLDIVHKFHQIKVSDVRVGGLPVAKDVEKLVRHRVTTELDHVDAELRGYVIEALVKSSNGVFVFAEMQLNGLAQVPEPDIKRYLDSNPCTSEMEDLYRSLFRKISSLPSLTKKLAKDCLLSALHSRGSLNSGPFMDAVSLENKSSTNPGAPYDADHLRDVTVGLLDISDCKFNPIKLIHPSLRTFMLHPTTPHSDELQDLLPEKKIAEANMAKMCLRHLLLEIEPRGCWDTCLFYCARYFDSHINSLSELPDDLQAIIFGLLATESKTRLKQILAWRFTANEDKYPNITCLGNPTDVTPALFLECVALASLREKLRLYIHEFSGPYGIFGFPKWPDNCYFLAAAVGNNAFRRLISRGVDVNQTTDGCTALHCAIRGLSAGYHNNTTVIRRLLDLGADWNLDARDTSSESSLECYETPLNTALSYHVGSAVEIIVKHESFNFAEWIKSVPENHANWISVVCKHGANIAQVDEDGKTALQVARLHGWQECVRILQELGATD